MALIQLNENDLIYLSTEYPKLKYDSENNTISGLLDSKLTYGKTGHTLKIKYHIEIKLETKEKSILPIVRESKNEIVNIAKRKKVSLADVHLSNRNGELCLIIPPKENKKYPSGFNLREYLYHIEEHLYWITYFDRYNKPPWKAQAHGIDGYIELYKEDQEYRPAVKNTLEKHYGKTINRKLMRKLIKNRKRK